jgi:lysophospholipase L1-like esterase
MLPRTGFETQRASLNALLRADFNVATSDPNVWLPAPGITYADVLIDVGNDANIGQAGQNTSLTYYDADQLHLNNTGYGVVAGYAVTAIRLIQ